MKLSTYNLSNFKYIPQIKKLRNEQVEAIEVVGNVLPFKVNNYVIHELIDWDNIDNDAMFKLTFPQKGMLNKNHYGLMWNTLVGSANKDVIKTTANKIRL